MNVGRHVKEFNYRDLEPSYRWHLRDAFDQMNINERMIYPGLDGVARVGGRHYYVRDEHEH